MARGDRRPERFAPMPNRALADERLHGIHLRVLGTVAAHDRFGSNGLGCTISTQAIATKIRGYRQNIAVALRQLAEWGYLERLQHPRHAQMIMWRVVYDDEADGAFLSGKTVMPHNDSSDPKPSVPSMTVDAKTVMPQHAQKILTSNVKKDIRAKPTENRRQEGARPDGRASSPTDKDGKTLRLHEQAIKQAEKLQRIPLGTKAQMEHIENECLAIYESREHDDPLAQWAFRLFAQAGWLTSDVREEEEATTKRLPE